MRRKIGIGWGGSGVNLRELLKVLGGLAGRSYGIFY